MANPSYLIRNQYSFCFRMRIPEDVQPVFKKTELRFSLKTGYLGQAKLKARLLAGLIQKLIHHLRKNDKAMNLNENEIAEIIQTFKAFALEDHLLRSLDLAEGDGTPGIAEVYGDIITRVANLEMVLKTGPERESWITNKLDSTLEGMQYDIKSEGYKDSPQYRELCRQVLKATIEHLEMGKEQLKSTYPELELDRLYGKQLGASGAQTKEDVTGQQKILFSVERSEGESSNTLKRLIQEYSEQQIKTGKWKPNVVRN